MIYQFNCSCGKKKEIRLQGFISDTHKERCKCGNQMMRLFTPPAIIYKGQGFYSTDHRDHLKGDKIHKKKQKLKEKYGNKLNDINDVLV